MPFETTKTQIFLDSGNPQDTKDAMDLLGFLDGQTTNPSLVSKHPEVMKCKEQGIHCTKEQVYGYYKEIVQEVSQLIPKGSVSIEVYADKTTTAQQMLDEARELNTWISNAHIKLPTTEQGLIAANTLVSEGINVNLTLCFSQAQAAAVYAATKGAKRGQVFISPFIGRIDDTGKNGFDLIKNISTMYASGDGHVLVLAASLRGSEHFMACLAHNIDIMTVPKKVLDEWGKTKEMPSDAFEYAPNLEPMPFEEYDLNAPWDQFDITHTLTNVGIEKFSADWNQLIG